MDFVVVVVVRLQNSSWARDLLSGTAFAYHVEGAEFHPQQGKIKQNPSYPPLKFQVIFFLIWKLSLE